MDKKTDVSRAKLEEGWAKENTTRRQLKKAGSKMPLPDVWVLCCRLQVKFKEIFASEQAQKQDAMLEVSGIRLRTGRCSDGARGSRRFGGSRADCPEGNLQSNKSQINAKPYFYFLRVPESWRGSESSLIFQALQRHLPAPFRGSKYISHQCHTPPPLSQAPFWASK